ncbi:uncharacterized protein EI97DRAFT_120282 [Westerdykella ornata]|uniref:Uncharacterized protein n=1 Tax=Westerdykella ornata TaxID=318751 RepID=A0A6A6JUN7_WESOR|nr:uncharacterized protein EI97DRAFT_120282 [Westerdykella ornata]KAF2280341.1 hypothetical protein EI97DRAFT_120282 [Westerdykella ornata]
MQMQAIPSARLYFLSLGQYFLWYCLCMPFLIKMERVAGPVGASTSRCLVGHCHISLHVPNIKETIFMFAHSARLCFRLNRLGMLLTLALSTCPMNALHYLSTDPYSS